MDDKEKESRVLDVNEYGYRTPKFSHREIVIRATGTTFKTGEVFRPTLNDLYAVVRRFRELGLADDLVPGAGIVLVSGNRSAIHDLIPKLLEAAAARNYANIAPFQVRAILWVMACYWHTWLGGPRPAMPRPTRTPRLETPVFKCPYCHAKWHPKNEPEAQVNILREFAKWMYRHANENCHYLVGTSRRHIQDVEVGA